MARHDKVLRRTEKSAESTTKSTIDECESFQTCQNDESVQKTTPAPNQRSRPRQNIGEKSPTTSPPLPSPGRISLRPSHHLLSDTLLTLLGRRHKPTSAMGEIIVRTRKRSEAAQFAPLMPVGDASVVEIAFLVHKGMREVVAHVVGARPAAHCKFELTLIV